MNEYDQLMSDLLDDLRALLDAGLSSKRGADEYSTEEQMIIKSRRVWELATARPDTKPTKRQDEHRATTERDRVFSRIQPWHEAEKAQRAEQAKGAPPSR